MATKRNLDGLFFAVNEIYTAWDGGEIATEAALALMDAAAKEHLKGAKPKAKKKSKKKASPKKKRTNPVEAIENPTRLGRLLRKQREKAGLTTTQLAKKMAISASTLGQIERGVISCPPGVRLDGAAKVLGVSVKVLTEAAVCDYRRFLKTVGKRPKKSSRGRKAAPKVRKGDKKPRKVAKKATKKAAKKKRNPAIASFMRGL